MQKSTFDLEKKLLAEGYDFVVGTDEAGRGPLAGPVVAAAVSLMDMSGNHDEDLFDLVRDSKKLSGKQREKIFDFICENFYVGIGICDHRTIDRINILEASFLAMKMAINDLMKKIKSKKDTKYLVLVDGNKKIPNLSLEQEAIIGGDRSVKSISAASIIAKVKRDRLMLEMRAKYPEYRFEKHKGYGTKMHMDLLQEYGPCEIHRRSFHPVGDLAKRFKR